MFGRKKSDNSKKPKRSSNGGLAQFGLIDVPDLENFDYMNSVKEDSDDDDDALEAELLALTSGGGVHIIPKKAVPAAVAPSILDKMVADSLRDIPSDESVSGDDDDPELLEELTGIVGVKDKEEDCGPNAVAYQSDDRVLESPPTQSSSSPSNLVSTLQERLATYKQAEANAKSAGEAARARRIGRGIKTLEDMLKKTKSGKPIDENEIPPPVAIQVTKKPEPTTTISLDNQLEEKIDSQPPSYPPPPLPSTESPPLVPPRRYSSISPPKPTRTAPVPPSMTGAVLLPGFNDLVDTNENTVVVPITNGKEDSTLSKSVEMDTYINNLDEDLKKRKENVASLSLRRDQYKLAAVHCKKAGDVDSALRYLKIAKQFENVINAVEEGKPVDLSEMPPSPPLSFENVAEKQQPPLSLVSADNAKEEQEKQMSSGVQSFVTPGLAEETLTTSEEQVYQVIPNSVSEALEQRLKAYQEQEESARTTGNGSKARRMGRIVKQYQDAIKLNKAGKPIPVDELPTPPGFAPIPVNGNKPPAESTANVPSVVPTPKTTPPTSPESTGSSSVKPNPANAESSGNNSSQQINPKKRTVMKVEMSLLLSRQKEFKLAALEAKRKGEMNQAKEYLRLAKGFDPLIEAANCGLPVDINSVPIPPSLKKELESDFDIITANDCIPNSDSEIYNKLETDLTNQLKMCMHTRNHFKAIGDIASANRFEQLALHSKKDLDVLRVANKRNEPVPRFHYEMKSFSIVKCNTDLTDNDVELTLVQGINYNVPNPKEVDTYVKFDFPYPSEDPQKDKTSIVYNTNNPEYNAKFPLTINRNSRACQRVFKRHSIKCEVWSKGGFLRYDNLIGTASVKLQPLETVCTLHDSFDLMDGRKAVGGKLEVKIRIRNPIAAKQVEQVQEKWLVIDH